jgi:hypothetical protein
VAATTGDVRIHPRSFAVRLYYVDDMADPHGEVEGIVLALALLLTGSTDEMPTRWPS